MGKEREIKSRQGQRRIALKLLGFLIVESLGEVVERWRGKVKVGRGRNSKLKLNG